MAFVCQRVRTMIASIPPVIPDPRVALRVGREGAFPQGQLPIGQAFFWPDGRHVAGPKKRVRLESPTYSILFRLESLIYGHFVLRAGPPAMLHLSNARGGTVLRRGAP